VQLLSFCELNRCFQFSCGSTQSLSLQLNSKGEPRVHLYRDKPTHDLKGEALITYANEIYANAAVDIFNGWWPLHLFYPHYSLLAL